MGLEACPRILVYVYSIYGPKSLEYKPISCPVEYTGLLYYLCYKKGTHIHAHEHHYLVHTSYTFIDFGADQKYSAVNRTSVAELIQNMWETTGRMACKHRPYKLIFSS